MEVDVVVRLDGLEDCVDLPRKGMHSAHCIDRTVGCAATSYLIEDLGLRAGLLIGFPLELVPDVGGVLLRLELLHKPAVPWGEIMRALAKRGSGRRLTTRASSRATCGSGRCSETAGSACLAKSSPP